MIKFNCLIHKETGMVIKYEDWLNKYRRDERIKFYENVYEGYYTRTPEEMLFSDDFEIIYDSEFTTKELKEIFGTNCSRKLKNKSLEIGLNRAELKDKYGIEV